MALRKNESINNFRRDPSSGYGDGHRPIPAAGEDRDESIYRNPVGAQSGYELEGQRKGPTLEPPTRLYRHLHRRLLIHRSADDRNQGTEEPKGTEEPRG